MSGKPPAFQFYAADFKIDTEHWTAIQVGAYIRLLIHEWVNGAIPTKMSALARIAGVEVRNMQKMWSAELAKKFTTDGAEMYVNLRLEEERVKQANFSKRQAEKGKRSAEIRAALHPTAVEPETQPKVNSSSSSSSSSLKKNITTIAEYAETATSAVEVSLRDNYKIWRKAFPALDLETETSKALSWLLANPKNKKSNFTRFLRNWLSRAQERAPRAMQTGPKTMKQIIQEEGL